jgi:8-oxo-dGTP diphosphatase
MPIVKDAEVVRPLLESDPDRTHSIRNLINGAAGGRASWVRVDNPAKPQAVLCRSRFLYLYARNRKAAAQLVRELPKRWRLAFAATATGLEKAVRRELTRRNAVSQGSQEPPKRRIRWTAPCWLYVLDPQGGIFRGPDDRCQTKGRNQGSRAKRSLVIDRRHRVGKLTCRDAALVTKYWPHGKSRGYVAWRIQAGPTCAIRRRGKLVAWAMTHADGAMGMLHVLDEYRGRGMARSITTALAERCLKAGIRPFLYIVKKNTASIRLTESMGFTRVGELAWFGE